MPQGDAASVRGAWDPAHFSGAALEGSMDPVSMFWWEELSHLKSLWLPAGAMLPSPPHLGAWGLALSSGSSTHLMSPWAMPAHQAFMCKTTSSQGAICYPTVFLILGFFPRFGEANPLTEMLITPLRNRQSAKEQAYTEWGMEDRQPRPPLDSKSLVVISAQTFWTDQIPQ